MPWCASGNRWRMHVSSRQLQGVKGRPVLRPDHVNVNTHVAPRLPWGLFSAVVGLAERPALAARAQRGLRRKPELAQPIEHACM